jgi:hypothetical protein
MSENRAFYQRQLADLQKNRAALETGIGYTLLQSGEAAASAEDFAAYTQFEQKKTECANRINLIQELVATQKDVARQLVEVDTAGKRLAVESDRAFADLGLALADNWPEHLSDFGATDYGAVLALKAKLQGSAALVSDEEGEAPRSAPKLQAIQQFFASLKDSASASLSNLSRGQVQHRLDKAAEKLGRAVFASSRLDDAAVAGKLESGVLASCDRCRAAAGEGANLAERREGLKAQQEATALSLKSEGAMGAGRLRIEELKKQIRVATAGEDALALQAGRSFADTVFDAEGAPVKKPETAAKKAAGDGAAELLSKLNDDGRVRVQASACAMDLQLLDMDHELAGLAAKMVKGNARIASNREVVAKLNADTSDTEAMITAANEASQKLTAERGELAQKRAAIQL